MSVTLVEFAREYAFKAHSSQMYGTQPYIYHLDAVVGVLLEFGFTDETFQVAGYLHDIVEDTAITLEDLDQFFNAGIVSIVDGVTSEPGPNRKTRNAATYPRIAEDIRRVIVKLADRIANVRHSKETGSDLFKMYQKEYPEFRAALYAPDSKASPMWKTLDEIMDKK